MDNENKVEGVELETAEMLSAQIEELQKKLVKAELAEQEEDKESLVKVAVADVTIVVSKGHEVQRANVTAPEAALLFSQFHASAGGVPIKGIANIRQMDIDLRREKARLSRRYGAKKVETLYPGAEPKMPLTFKRALGIGAATVVPAESLGDFHVSPMNDGGNPTPED